MESSGLRCLHKKVTPQELKWAYVLFSQADRIQWIAFGGTIQFDLSCFACERPRPSAAFVTQAKANC
jgi:hypothetical protein